MDTLPRGASLRRAWDAGARRALRSPPGNQLRTGAGFVTIHSMNLLQTPVTRRAKTWIALLGILSGALRVGAADTPAVPTAPKVEASKESPFVNSLGMKFVPVPGTPALFSAWETRVGDFEAFVKDTGYDATQGTISLGTNRWKPRGDTWKSPGFPQTDRHAVCGVSWVDARAFCDWLSKKEGRTYRLPTDMEWSAAMGISGEVGASPKERSGKIANRFPWGSDLPPNVNGLPAGNYPGSEASETNWPPAFRVIPDFRDPFARTAPVASFPANSSGIHDLGGNVWEWCEDAFEPGKETKVVRGASWVDNLENILLSSYRHYGRPEMRNTSVGFRCVLVP